jgi:hypothetical protein
MDVLKGTCCCDMVSRLQVMHVKNVLRKSLSAYSSPTAQFVPGQRCWNADCKADVALPCATQVGLWAFTQFACSQHACTCNWCVAVTSYPISLPILTSIRGSFQSLPAQVLAVRPAAVTHSQGGKEDSRHP